MSMWRKRREHPRQISFIELRSFYLVTSCHPQRVTRNQNQAQRSTEGRLGMVLVQALKFSRIAVLY